MKNPTCCSLLLALGLAALTTANAQIVTYDVANTADNASFVATSQVDANVSASTLTANGALVNELLGAAGDFMVSGWGNTLDLSKYYQFTITPNANQQVTYESITLGIGADLGGNTPTWSLRTSVNGFAADLATLNFTAGDLNQQTFSAVSIAALGTQSQAVTFRLYGYGGNPDPNAAAGLAKSPLLGGTGSDLILNGTVSVVPEPQHYAFLAGLGLIAFAAYRRFKLQQA